MVIIKEVLVAECAGNRQMVSLCENANIIYGTTCDERLEGVVRVSLVATGIDLNSAASPKPLDSFSALQIDNSVYQKEFEDEEKNISANICTISDEKKR